MSVKDVMTVNPKRITSDAYAASALNLMEKYSITALAVVDADNACNTCKLCLLNNTDLSDRIIVDQPDVGMSIK